MASLTQGREFEQTQGDGEGREAWWAAVHGVVKSRAQLSDPTATTNAQVFKLLYIFTSPLFLFVCFSL